MQLELPPDLEALVRERLASGAFSSVEEVLRHALEAQADDELWTAEEREALERKIDRSLRQAADGRSYGPEEAQRRLSELRAQHLAERKR